MEKNAEKSGKIFNWITLRRLLYFAKPHKTAFLGLVFLTILAGALSPIRPYLIQLSVDKYMAEGDMGGLTNMALLMIGLLILQFYCPIYSNLFIWLVGSNHYSRHQGKAIQPHLKS
jgi:ATP-binding cassette subfamily B protein